MVAVSGRVTGAALLVVYDETQRMIGDLQFVEVADETGSYSLLSHQVTWPQQLPPSN